jgi:mono/diheme cytochrome c family protein
VPVGQPLRLRLTSDDVTHGFAIGQSDLPALDVEPGKVIETTLTFDRPGKYVFYCTRWCGLGHWRMRGAIEVTGPLSEPVTESPPLYVRLGINIDEPEKHREIDNAPYEKPSAVRGASLGVIIPSDYLSTDYYRAHNPAEVWQSLRADPISKELTDTDVWDLVAFVWQSNTSVEALAEGGRLFAANCSACHGETGAGDGVAAKALVNKERAAMTEFGHSVQAPADFTGAHHMLGASPALLQGKIIRGGMGTGMPYWGPIFTESQTWALVDYLWSFTFAYQEAS